jgi:hypothetical protein
MTVYIIGPNKTAIAAKANIEDILRQNRGAWNF